MKLIGVSGAHGVGKSTLISKIEERFGGRVTIVRGLARGVIRRGFPLGKRADTDSYVCLVAEYIKARTSIIRDAMSDVGPTLAIFDRTILDTLSYALVNINRGVAVGDHVIELLNSIWDEERSLFSMFIYVPIEFEQKYNPNNDSDESYRHQVSDTILSNLELSGANFISVAGSVDSRFNNVASEINKYF